MSKSVVLVLVLTLTWYLVGLAGSGFIVAMRVEEARRFPYWTDQERAEQRRIYIGEGLFMALWGSANFALGFFVTGFGQYGWWSAVLPSANEAVPSVRSIPSEGEAKDTHGE